MRMIFCAALLFGSLSLIETASAQSWRLSPEEKRDIDQKMDRKMEQINRDSEQARRNAREMQERDRQLTKQYQSKRVDCSREPWDDRCHRQR